MRSKLSHRPSVVASPVACESLEGRRLLAAITTGQRLTGALAANGQVASFEFSLNAGDRFVFLATSTSFVTPKLDVFAPNGTSVGTSTGGVSATLELVAGATGVYTARVRDSFDNDTGGFAVSFFRARVPQPVDADSRVLETGRTVNGTLDAGDLDVYTFAANAGDQVSLLLGQASGFYTPRLTLYAPDGAVVSNVNGGLGAIIESPTLTQSGTYIALVREVGDNDTGAYRLSFLQAGQPQAAGDDGGPLAAGVRTYGRLEYGDFDVFSFDAAEGSSFVLNATTASGFVTPNVRVYAPNGTLVTSAIGGVTASVNASGLFQTGKYLVVVRDENVNDTGTYALSLAQFPAAVAVDGDGGPIASGQTLTAALPYGDLDLYTINLTAGSAATFRMTALDGFITPRLQMFDPEGLPLSNADGGTLAVTAPITGRYYLLARDVNDNDTGRYSLTVNNAAAVVDTRPPTVTRRLFDTSRAAHRVTLQLNESLGSSFAETDLLVTRVGVANLPTTDYVAVYDDTNYAITIEFNAFANGTLPNGAYRITLRGGFVTDVAGNALAANDVFDFGFVRGDASGNRATGFEDFVALQANFGAAGRTYAEGDFDYDGDVDFSDFVLLQSSFGVTV